MRLLLVEDNELLGDGLVTALKQENYAVDWVRSGTQANNAPLNEHFDLIILDLGLPGIDGISLLKAWRVRGIQTPVLILTARDAVASKVEGLDSGGDDFMTKPFERDELMARIRSLLRRARQTQQVDSRILFGDIVLDTASHAVYYHSAPVNLARREFSLLHLLIEQPGKVFSREQLQQAMYSWDEDIASNTLEVHIHNLRKKFYPELIRTIRGIGYIAGKPVSGESPANTGTDS